MSADSSAIDIITVGSGDMTTEVRRACLAAGYVVRLLTGNTVMQRDYKDTLDDCWNFAETHDYPTPPRYATDAWNGEAKS